MFPKLNASSVHRATAPNTSMPAAWAATIAPNRQAVNKAAAKPKFKVRAYTRCQVCGRPHSVYRKFGLCRVCLREKAHRGELPGVTKSSW